MTNNPQSQRKYYYFTDLCQINEQMGTANWLLNQDKFLIASNNNQLRFLTADGTLAMVPHKNASELHNSLFNNPNLASELANNELVFFLERGHASMLFKCGNCDNGLPHNQSYDFESIIEQDMPRAYNASNNNTIKFYLTDHQATQILATISNLHSLSKNGKYKYTETIHDCVAFLTDVYQQSGFSNHFSEYFTDNEILKMNSDTAITAFVHRFYYVGNYITADRGQVGQFVRSIWGEDYAANWQPNCDYTTGLYEGIRDKEIDLARALNNPVISPKIEDIKQTRSKVYPELIKHSFTLNNFHDEINAVDIENITKYFINKKTTYEDLYYYHVLPHELAITQLFKDTPYADKIITPSHKYISEICNIYPPNQQLEFSKICDLWQKNKPANEVDHCQIAYQHYNEELKDSNNEYNAPHNLDHLPKEGLVAKLS